MPSMSIVLAGEGRPALPSLKMAALVAALTGSAWFLTTEFDAAIAARAAAAPLPAARPAEAAAVRPDTVRPLGTCDASDPL